MQKKTIVVTGGAGFVGSHLCKALLDLEHAVLCVDNFTTGSKETLAHLQGAIEIIEHDLCYPLYVEADEIYNLASPLHTQSDPIQTTKTSVLGALNMLELSKKTGARFLQASTSEVYGDPLVHPQDENYWGHVNPIGIRSCYAEGKRCAETLTMDFHRLGVEVRLARIFNTYGPHMHANNGRVVSNFILQALQNEPISIYGKGDHTRSFCYVSDVVAGLIKLMESPYVGPINLGNPAECTILELAEKVIALTGSKSTIVYKPLPSDDPKRRKPDISKAQALLNWQPMVALEEGLTLTIRYFENVLINR